MTRRSHPEVRDLLAKIKYPYRLETDTLGRALRDAMRRATVREAVLALIEEELRPIDPRLATIIERCDVHGVKVAAVAGEFHVTPRQLFRYRSDAVAALAERIKATLQSATTAVPRPGESWTWHALSYSVVV